VILGTDGNFHGTTWGGEISNGSVFKATPDGTLTTLHNFQGPDGYWPEAGVVQGVDGNFYGTTVANRGCGGQWYCGTVFKITPAGVLTTLYIFCAQQEQDCPDGTQPHGGLVQGTDGNFYGTTVAGGNSSAYFCAYEGTCGTVFRITPGGALTTIYRFGSQGDCSDGGVPEAGLLLGADGNFYGTTRFGGASGPCFDDVCGTIFKITPNGTQTTLHAFQYTDGGQPQTGLVQGNDGNFYGTTSEGGANSCGDYAYGWGTIFKITPGGDLTTLYNFCSLSNCADGSGANELVQDTNGTFYGTTQGGGANDTGTVFSLSVGLGPFVETNPNAGKIGAAVGILGTNLAGATGVKLNGIETAFRLVSSTFIEAKVPSGATTGKVQVKLPSGTLTSNMPFIVLR